MAKKKDSTPKKMKRKAYERELAKLEVELVKLQGWILPETQNLRIQTFTKIEILGQLAKYVYNETRPINPRQ